MTAPTPRSAVVTGANRADGIGLALVRELRARGCAPVVGTYRDTATATPLLDAAAGDPDVLAAEVDVTSDASAEAFGRWCAEHLDRVDLLVNNAGIGASEGSVLTAPIEDLEYQLQVHGLGMLRVTRALLPLMGSGAVAVSVSSSLASIADMDAGSTYYAPAKAFQNALTKHLAGAVRRDGIIAFSASPGWVSTSMGGTAAPLTPEESARRLAELVLGAGPRDAGTFRTVDGDTLAW
ncbi:MAG: SDR family oxidoreductase [Chloroflexi bacterium]|nr:SDR family oxidoreductase [Chloroflexota bacterium]MYD65026.1 SDR family oxidoreductase [Chloroflexota bacterium]